MLQQAFVHPLVLLSILDHYKRSALAPGKRVVGVLLGFYVGSRVHITSSYGVPFEEVDNESTVWYLDYDYHLNMCELSKKINARERPIGWYHSGPRLRPNDLTINDLFRSPQSSSESTQTSNPPVLLVLDVASSSNFYITSGKKPQESPMRTYVAIEEIGEEGGKAGCSWAHLPSSLEADEAEEVGMEHLLRDITTKSDLFSSISEERTTSQHTISSEPKEEAPLKAFSFAKSACSNLPTKILSSIDNQLADIDNYLEGVLSGRLPVNHSVLAGIQEVFNMLSNSNSSASTLNQALTQSTNDHLITVNVAALSRSVVALHNLLINRRITSPSGVEASSSVISTQ